MFHRKVAQFIERLDEIENELKSPESMKMSDINSWCRKILSYEEKIPIIKKHVFQVDLDFYEKKVNKNSLGNYFPKAALIPAPITSKVLSISSDVILVTPSAKLSKILSI